MKKHLLKDIALDEVSLVDLPSNPGARVALFKRKEDQTLSTNLDQMIAFAKRGGTTAFAKRDWMGALDALAKRDRRDGETYEQSFARILKTPDGRDLYNEYRRAPGAAYTEPTPRPSSETVDLSTSSPTWATVEKLADEHRETMAAEGKTISKGDAISAIFKTDVGRELKKRFNAEAAAISKRGVRI